MINNFNTSSYSSFCETIYPEPEKFIPQSPSLENKKDRTTAAFLAFGGGPRNFIGNNIQLKILCSNFESIMIIIYEKLKLFFSGMRFALTESKVALVHMV